MEQNSNIPWIEKYRPKNITELCCDKNTRNKLNKFIEDKNMPNIIITGIPGIGKTTTILCLAEKLLGKYIRQGVLELNASDDRGIKGVQDSIIYFCKKKLDLESDEYCKHKIVLLDEADNMTKKAQQLINNLMEKYKNTRFAFTCNNSAEIIEAIQSRCIIFRYKRLSNKKILNRLKTICEQEKVPFNDQGLDAIITISQGDMRQAINNLQLIFNGFQFINEENVFKLCDRPHPLIIKNIFMACREKNISKALIYLQELRNNGFSSSDISISMIETIKTTKQDEISEKIKINFMNEISKTCLIISSGIDSALQLTGCICKMCQ